MKFGVCGGLERAEIAAAAGYDYGEWTVGDLLKPTGSNADFEAARAARKDAPLPYPVANIFIPGKMKITGPDVDMPTLRDFVAITMQRAEQASIEIIVFGSGGARRIPEGYDRGQAHDQLVAFGRMVGPLAADHGVTVAVEPLNQEECNVLNSVSECADYVREVDQPGFRLLVDAYHMLKDDDPFDSIVTHRDLLVHTHIATAPNRLPPGAEDSDFSAFFEALATAGYDGRVSIEARPNDAAAELPLALDLMKQLMNDSAA